MTGIAGLGLLSSLAMKALPLHTEVDERWGIEEGATRNQQPRGEVEEIDAQEMTGVHKSVSPQLD